MVSLTMRGVEGVIDKSEVVERMMLYSPFIVRALYLRLELRSTAP